MTKLDKVIKALEFCNSSEDCRGCVYFTDALKGKCKCGADTLELLKDNTARIKKLPAGEYCENCDSFVRWFDKYCHECGKKLIR